jgi:hypothetical protein
MSDNSRIYAVKDGADVSLIEATSQAQALRFIGKTRYTIEVASPKLIAAMMSKGHKVLDATTEKTDGE